MVDGSENGRSRGDYDDCPECGGRVVRRNDELTCSNCGLVVAVDRLDRGPEWRASDADERRRTGAPLTRSRHDRGLSTEIGHGGDDLRLTGRKRRRVARMRREHNRARAATTATGNRIRGFREIGRLASELSLPDRVQEAACILFESAQDEGLLHGRSIEGFAAAAVYAACRMADAPRSRAEILDPSQARQDELASAYDALNRDLGLPTGPPDPRDYLPRFASELDLPTPVEERARELATEARDAGILSGRNPCGVAAACLYAAAGEQGRGCTQADAAAVADVAPATIRSVYYALEECVEEA